MDYDDLTSPVLRNLLADHEKLKEQVYGPSRRLVEEFQRQQRDIQKYYGFAFADMGAVKDALAAQNQLREAAARQTEVFSRVLESSPLTEVLTPGAWRVFEKENVGRSVLPEFERMAADAAALTRSLEFPYLQEMQQQFDELAAKAMSLRTFPESAALKTFETQLAGVAAIEKITAWALPDITRISDTSVLAEALLPIRVRTQFVEETVKQLLAAERDSSLSVALMTAVRHATIERDAYADAMSRYPSPNEDAHVEVDLDRDLNIPREGRAELIRRAGEADSTDAGITADTNAHRAAMLSIVLVDLIVNINTAAKVSGKQDVFSPTSRGYSSVVVLSTTIARDPQALGRVINALFFLVYEGAGDDKLRFQEEGGGPLKSEECEPIWQLKHLRLNEDHDIDHGSKNDRLKKWRSLGKDLRAMGLERLPQTPAEFEELQLRIYEGVIAVLRLALSRFQLPLS